MVPNLPSYIKDTRDFIRKIENIDDLPENFILVSLDVTSLYTNIPNQEGLVSVANQLRQQKPKFLASYTSILSLLKLVLHCNNFSFKNEHYLQIGGTAMGTSLAPSYANLFMGCLEDKLLKGYELKPAYYYRYIDDIFLIWTHGLSELTKFTDYLNDSHKSIKFTFEFNESEMTFLDTITYRIPGTNKIGVKLYTKPTDTHAYLEYSSEHPRHQKESIPYSQFLRLRRNCTNIEDFKKESIKMKTYFKYRNYPQKLIEDSFDRALHKERASLFINREKETLDVSNTRIPFVSTHNPTNPNFKTLISQIWPILNYSEKCRQVFTHMPLFASRRERNLKDRLVKAEFGQKHNVLFIQSSCNRPNCKYCIKIKKTKNFKSSITQEKFKKKQIGDCETRNIIYMVSCSLCRKQYIGQTKRPFRNRMYEHMRYILQNNDEPTGRHYNLPEHNLDHAQFEIIELLSGDPDSEQSANKRDNREDYWILKLKSLTPLGVNNRLSKKRQPYLSI